MCGEHGSAAQAMGSVSGSSPHVRGARKIVCVPPPHTGIIPACAGSTSTTRARRCRPRDHPRMCGEHSARRRGRSSVEGSSPHVRGAPFRQVKHGDDIGIIPACAGSTISSMRYRAVARDHPRMCGEHFFCVLCFLLLLGSSPHVRGARRPRWPRGCRLRIIPACAGSTRTAVTPMMRSRDHPRMCGEHIKYAVEGATSQGSSPHVRGARPLCCRHG